MREILYRMILIKIMICFLLFVSRGQDAQNTVFQSDICNCIFPSKSQLTFSHQRTRSQGLQSWLRGCHFPHDTVSTHISTSVHRVLMWTYGDVKCIIRNVQKVVGAITHIICQTFSSSIKTCVICFPVPFLEAWQLCTKGPSASLILGLFWAPHNSTSMCLSYSSVAPSPTGTSTDRLFHQVHPVQPIPIFDMVKIYIIKYVRTHRSWRNSLSIMLTASRGDLHGYSSMVILKYLSPNHLQMHTE